jgi:hypothetical protein
MMQSMQRFLNQMARSIVNIFSPRESEVVPIVGFQPITDDIYRCRGSACYTSELDID